MDKGAWFKDSKIKKEMSDVIKHPQSFYDENRELFDADTGIFDIDTLSDRCEHYFERTQFSRVVCKKCHMGYTENNRFILNNGKITGIK